jgi:hypothetical protein
VDHGEDAWQGGGGGNSPVHQLDGEGGGVRAAGTAVLDSGGKELLQNRGGEGDVRRYINRKEEARGRLSPERSGSDGEKAPIQRPQVTQWTGLARGA